MRYDDILEINLRKKRWLICGSYNPHRTTIDSQIDCLIRNLALYSSTELGELQELYSFR